MVDKDRAGERVTDRLQKEHEKEAQSRAERQAAEAQAAHAAMIESEQRRLKKTAKDLAEAKMVLVRILTRLSDGTPIIPKEGPVAEDVLALAKKYRNNRLIAEAKAATQTINDSAPVVESIVRMLCEQTPIITDLVQAAVLKKELGREYFEENSRIGIDGLLGLNALKPSILDILPGPWSLVIECISIPAALWLAQRCYFNALERINVQEESIKQQARELKERKEQIDTETWVDGLKGHKVRESKIDWGFLEKHSRTA